MLSTLSFIQLQMKHVFGYMVIFLAVCTVMLIPAAGFYVATKINRSTRRIARNTSRDADCETDSTSEDHIMNPSSIAVIALLERLSAFPDFTLKTLPTYGAAMANTRPLDNTLNVG